MLFYRSVIVCVSSGLTPPANTNNNVKKADFFLSLHLKFTLENAFMTFEVKQDD